MEAAAELRAAVRSAAGSVRATSTETPISDRPGGVVAVSVSEADAVPTRPAAMPMTKMLTDSSLRTVAS
jgi:hypothetical protein